MGESKYRSTALISRRRRGDEPVRPGPAVHQNAASLEQSREPVHLAALGHAVSADWSGQRGEGEQAEGGGMSLISVTR
jgi:hypothetical protein